MNKELNNEKVIVTGSNGRLGKELVKRLKEEKANVLEVDLPEFDLREKVLRIPDDTKFIFHLASIIPRKKDLTIFELWDNSKMIYNVIKNNKTAKIIYASGGNVYGNSQKIPITEKSFIKSKTCYGASKILCEVILDIFSKMNGFSLVKLRISNIWGPQFRKRGELLDKLFSNLSKNKDIKLYGKDVKRDRVWIDDVVEALILSTKKNVHGVFNIGSGQSFSTKFIASEIKSKLKSKSKIKFTNSDDTIMDNRLSIVKARKILKWTPKVKINKGINILEEKWLKKFL